MTPASASKNRDSLHRTGLTEPGYNQAEASFGECDPK